MSGTDDQVLLEAARRGDETAYRDLVEIHRPALHAHCYRMLASVDEADDAVQEALVRAWRGLARFEGRSSVRTWLYSIATNAAIDASTRRARRELPLDMGPAAGIGDDPGAPLSETYWVEPYPDQYFGVPDGKTSPEARYEQRESIEIAFIAALQHLPATQRSVLILREVLGFTALEVAEIRGTTVPAVNSALQRARAAVASLLPARSQQATLRSAEDSALRQLAGRYMDAIDRGDVELLLSLLTDDATWCMPPLGSWFQGHAAIAAFHRRYVCPEHWQHRAMQANGQLAIACYTFRPERGTYVAAVIDTLTLEGTQIAAVTAFLVAEQPSDEADHFLPQSAFERFGLPVELPAE